MPVYAVAHCPPPPGEGRACRSGEKRLTAQVLRPQRQKTYIRAHVYARTRESTPKCARSLERARAFLGPAVSQASNYTKPLSGAAAAAFTRTQTAVLKEFLSQVEHEASARTLPSRRTLGSPVVFFIISFFSSLLMSSLLLPWVASRSERLCHLALRAPGLSHWNGTIRSMQFGNE